MNTLEMIRCPVCHSDDFVPVTHFEKDLHIHKYGSMYGNMTQSLWKSCAQCGFVLQNPRPSKQALNEFYLNNQYHDSIEWDPANFKKFSEWYYGDKIKYIIEKTGIKKGRVFDIGFGHGGALAVFKDLGWETYGVESDTRLFDFAQSNYQLTHVQNDILHRDLVISEKMDVIFSNHAFEHFADLPSVMDGIKKMCHDKTYIFTCVPTYYSNRSSLSLQWMNSAHYNMFTHLSLNALFSDACLQERHHTYRGFLKEVDELWHLSQKVPYGIDPVQYYVPGVEVKKYIEVINPARTKIFGLVFSNWSKKVEMFRRLKRFSLLVLQNPKASAQKIGLRIKRVLG